MVGRVKGGKSWHERQSRDHATKQARQHNYRSRAAFKLMEMDDKFKLLKKDSVVIELGAAPGGWSQIIAPKVKTLVACDLLEMDPVKDVVFVQGDFTEPSIQDEMLHILSTPATLVCSDMAPNLSGIKSSDHAKMEALMEAVMSFAKNYVGQRGGMIMKCFEFPGAQTLIKAIRNDYAVIHRYKPPTSRAESSEFYLLALNKK